MPRELIPLHVNDISALARNIRSAYADREKQPSHLEVLNILAKGAGYKLPAPAKRCERACKGRKTPCYRPSERGACDPLL